MKIDWQKLHGDHFRGCRILITGGAGFIGSHLAVALVELGANVVILDDLSGGARSNIETLPIRFVQKSILDETAVAACMAGCRYVFHQAALGSVPRSVEHPRMYHDVNITGTSNVLESARQAGVSRVMFAASSSAYGDNNVPWTETMPSRPQSPYAATKVAGEALLRAFSASYGLDTVSLRYFNIFGPRQNANSAYAAVIAAFANAFLSGNTPVIYGDGEQSRDFTYVANAVHANLLAARHAGTLRGEVLNVGCGTSITVNRLAAVVSDLLESSQQQPLHKQERAGDIRHSFASLDCSSRSIEYRPLVDFETGLRWTIDWYRTQKTESRVECVAA